MAGENWPPVNVRHEMLSEAVQVIGGLFDGGYFNYAGDYFRVDSAKLWDLPEMRTPVAIAVSGEQSVKRFAPVADAMIAVEPSPGLCHAWDSNWVGGPADQKSRKIGQLPISFGHDRGAAIKRAREQFRWFAGGWKVNAELPGPPAFDAATQFVTESDVAGAIACGDGLEPIMDGVRSFADAGFTDLALVQVGGDAPDEFLEFAANTLLPTLR